MSDKPGKLTAGERWVPLMADEHDLISYLTEYLYANLQSPRVAGKDSTDRPFVAWLTQTVGLMLVLIDVENDGSLGTVRGGPGILNYPVTLLE